MQNNEKILSFIIKGKDGKDVFKIADTSKEGALKQWVDKSEHKESEAIVTQVGGLTRQQLRERKQTQPVETFKQESKPVIEQEQEKQEANKKK